MMNLDYLIARMDISALATQQRADFAHWLTQRAYWMTTLNNALQKGQVLTVYIIPNARTGEVGYGLRSQSRLLPLADQVDLTQRCTPT